MKRAAYYVSGRIITGQSHMAALGGLSEAEKDDPHLVSGHFDLETGEFLADMERDHFFDKQLYLIRHGRCVESDDGDPDLSQDGLPFLRSTAEEFGKLDLRGFIGFASPMLRCLRTASLIQQLSGIKFQIVPALIETVNLCEGEVFKLRSRSDMFPDFEWPVSQEWHLYPESPCDFLERVKETLCGLPSKCIVVTHYGFICNLARLALCKEKAEALIEQGIPPASVTYIEREAVQRLGKDQCGSSTRSIPEFTLKS